MLQNKDQKTKQMELARFYHLKETFSKTDNLNKLNLNY